MDFAIYIYRGPNTETQKVKGALFQALQMASFLYSITKISNEHIKNWIM